MTTTFSRDTKSMASMVVSGLFVCSFATAFLLCMGGFEGAKTYQSIRTSRQLSGDDFERHFEDAPIAVFSGDDFEQQFEDYATEVLEGSTHATMVELVWNDDNKATIEFCQEGDDVFGYRLPGEETCGAAGIVVRMTPGENYDLTVRNMSDQVTNVHTHGLHIAGDGNSDDVTRYVDPGMCLDYHWEIVDFHMGGTSWLHSHQHGLTQAQVQGGAFAMLIIEETEDLLDQVGDQDDKNNIEAWMENELLLVAAQVGDDILGNGQDFATFELVENEWYRMRVLSVMENGKRRPLKFPESCTVHEVAYDGVWRFTVPNPEMKLEYFPTGASRIDFAIQCNESGPILFGPDYGITAEIIVREGETTNASPFVAGDQQWAPVRPYYLRDLTNGDPSVGEFQEREVVLTARTINGFSYDEEVPVLELQYDTLQEFTLNGTAPHPWHLHVYHMQTFGCDGHEDGEYYDTISAANDDCRVRTHIIDFGERVIMHCHNVGHEDQGMMVWVDVFDSPVQPKYDVMQKSCPAENQ